MVLYRMISALLCAAIAANVCLSGAYVAPTSCLEVKYVLLVVLAPENLAPSAKRHAVGGNLCRTETFGNAGRYLVASY